MIVSFSACCASRLAFPFRLPFAPAVTEAEAEAEAEGRDVSLLRVCAEEGGECEGCERACERECAECAERERAECEREGCESEGCE